MKTREKRNAALDSTAGVWKAAALETLAAVDQARAEGGQVMESPRIPNQTDSPERVPCTALVLKPAFARDILPASLMSRRILVRCSNLSLPFFSLCSTHMRKQRSKENK